MKGFAVVSAFVDKRTGKIIRPNDPVPEIDSERAQRLVRAGCLVHTGGLLKAPGKPAAARPTRKAKTDSPR